MIDPVEKFFEIKVDRNTVARGNVALRLGYRLMGRAPRSEAVTMPGKRRVSLLLQNLQHGLPDQSVDDARHAELSDPTVRLGEDGAVWRVMHCDVERKEQPVVKIPAVLPEFSGRASLRSKTGRPGSLLTGLGAVDKHGRAYWGGAPWRRADSKYAVGAASMFIER
jgi:hypothetical protein